MFPKTGPGTESIQLHCPVTLYITIDMQRYQKVSGFQTDREIQISTALVGKVMPIVTYDTFSLVAGISLT